MSRVSRWNPRVGVAALLVVTGWVSFAGQPGKLILDFATAQTFDAARLTSDTRARSRARRVRDLRRRA